MRRFAKVLLVALTMTTACILLTGSTPRKPEPKVQRFGMVIGLKPEMMAKYKKLHANPWPGVISMIRKCNIRNYSIYLTQLQPGKYYLFGYFEYVGRDFKGDMKKMAADTTTRKWWKETDPCQIPVPTRKKGEFWMNMEEVFHTD